VKRQTTGWRDKQQCGETNNSAKRQTTTCRVCRYVEINVDTCRTVQGHLKIILAGKIHEAYLVLQSV
ncbi:unnamed protein product, partial [Candidula unifasciata]